MSVAKVRRLVPTKDFTHFLTIPLAASSSMPQLRNSFLRFQNDASLTVPPGAIHNPQFYNLLVARLKLPTSRHVDDYSTTLRNFDMQKTLRAAETALHPSSSLKTNSTSIIEEKNLLAGVLPLRIKILGLSAGERFNPASTVILEAKPIDPTNRLPNFLLSLREFVATTGFMVNPGNEDTARRDVGDAVKIVNTIITRWYKVPADFGQEFGIRAKKGQKVPRIDARDLIDKYQAYEWGSDIPLEKLCLEELGSMAKRLDGTAVEKGRNVVATFELP